MQVIRFWTVTACDWLKNLASLFQPIRMQITTNDDLFAHVFPRLAAAILFDLSSDWFNGLSAKKRRKGSQFILYRRQFYHDHTTRVNFCLEAFLERAEVFVFKKISGLRQ